MASPGDPPPPFRLAVVQMDVRLGEPEANLRRIEERLGEARELGAELVVFPECSVTGYVFESIDEARAVAEPVPGPATERVSRRARDAGSRVVFGLIERGEDGRVHNTLVLVGPGGVVGRYRKTHLPHLGADHFVTPGDRGDEVHDAGLCRLGMNICYDAAFPEATRLLALAGADLVVLPTNWPPGAEEIARYAVNSRALENRVWFASCDRVGEERGFRFIGTSRIIDPDGRTLAEADATSETILTATIDPVRARCKQVDRVPGRHWIDRFADRRPDLYGPLARPRD